VTASLCDIQFSDLGVLSPFRFPTRGDTLNGHQGEASADRAAGANLFVIGPPKTGTTSLYHALARHSGVFAPSLKEPNYYISGDTSESFTGPGDGGLNRDIVRTACGYTRMFEGGAALRYRGDFSTSYFNNPTAQTSVPAVADAIIIVLRNPIDRAYSAYWHQVRSNREELGFEDALDVEADRLRRGYSWMWGYTNQSFYAKALAVWLRSEATSAVIYTEDLASEAEATMREVVRRLELGWEDEVLRPLQIRHNATGVPRSVALNRMLHPPHVIRRLSRFAPDPLLAYYRKVRAGNLGRPPEMAEETRSRLISLFEEDVQRCSEILGQDLCSRWLSRPVG
jgi:hypothetical protein